MEAEQENGPQVGYRRDGFTWAAFAALSGFGFLNAVLGPALPYLRATEDISYLVGVLHQVAFAVGGGLAGLTAAHLSRGPGRPLVIRVGLVAAGIVGLAVGYGDAAVVTIVAAFFVSLLGTSALIRLWAALADMHGRWRTVAMTEGEVSVSLGGIIAPLLVGGLAATVLTWRFAFVIGAVLVIAVVGASVTICIPPASPNPSPGPVSELRSAAVTNVPWLTSTLVMVFAVVALEWSLSFWLASYLNESVGMGRSPAAAMVAVLYAANLVGRVAASRLARHTTTGRLLGGAIATGLVGLPVLLAASTPIVAGVGLVVAGAGVGATFPLASSLHVASTPRAADAAVGQVTTVAAVAQILGPVAVAAIAQGAGLRIGLLVLPALALLAATALARHHYTRPIQ